MQVHSLKISLKIYLCACVYAYVYECMLCMCKCASSHKVQNGMLVSLELQLTENYEPIQLVAENQTQFLWDSKKCYQLVSQFWSQASSCLCPKFLLYNCIFGPVHAGVYV